MGFDLDKETGGEFSFTELFDSADSSSGAKMVKVSSIRRYPHNRVLSKEDVQPLVDELEEANWQLIHPVVVRPITDSKHDYELIAGERRWTAFQMGKQSEIAVTVRDYVTEADVAAINISENIHNTPDKLHFLAQKIRRYIDEFGVKKGVAAKRFGMDSAKLSLMVNYLWRINDIPEIAKVYRNGEGVTDTHTLSTMVKIYNVSPGALREALAFAESNNCFNRKFFDAVSKMTFADDLNAQMREFVFGEKLEEKPTPAAKKSEPSAPVAEEEGDDYALESEVDGMLDEEEPNGAESQEFVHVQNSELDSDADAELDEEPQDDDEESDTEDTPEVEDLVVDELVVKTRPASRIDIAFEIEGEDGKYMLASKHYVDEQGKIVVSALGKENELRVVDADKCKILWVA